MPGYAIGAMACLLTFSAPAYGQSDEITAQFDNAVRTFQFQDYEKAQSLFQQLLYPNLVLEDLDQIRDAREYLGASEWFLGNQEAARQELRHSSLAGPTMSWTHFITHLT